MTLPRSARPPNAFVCFVLLAVIAISLRLLGLGRTIGLANRIGAKGRHDEVFPHDLVRATAERVARAGAFYPGRAECLEQSMVLLILLRRRGLPAQLRLGVQNFPFAAHAWVELDGRPINEREELVTQMTTFPSIGG
jgi:hypothetical protein